MRAILAGLVIALVVVASIGVSLYAQNQNQAAELRNDSALITRLTSDVMAKNSSISTLEANVTALNGRIANLNAAISALMDNQTSNRAQIQALEARVSSLTNESANLRLALAIAGNARGYFVRTYFVNMTFAVGANSSIQLVGDINGNNGTMVTLGFETPACIFLGTSGIQGVQGFGILVGNRFGAFLGAGQFEASQTENSSQFQVWLQNDGTTPQSCVLSALYVYQSAPIHGIP